MKRLKSILDVAFTVSVIVVAGLVMWRQFAPTGRLQGRPPIEDASGTIKAELATRVRGTGPVALVEFADFECPFCGRHARDVEPQIADAFVDTGVVREVFVNYPLASHRQATQAGAAAECAGNQGQFWEMHDAIFGNQSALGKTDLVGRVRALGLDVAAFEKCIDGPDVYSLIERHKMAARSLGISMTPTFFLGTIRTDGSVVLKKRINGALSFDEFRAAITEAVPPEAKGRIREVTLNAPTLASDYSR